MSYYHSKRQTLTSPKRRQWQGHSGRPRTNRRKSNETIDPSRFIRIARPETTTTYQATHSFSDFEFAPIIKTNLVNKGYVIPSAIQDQAIPVGLSGKDVIGIASTGTGKTAAFLLPILQRLVTDQHSCAVIIAPTRELAQQIQSENRALSKGIHLQDALLIGGVGMGAQFRDLRSNPRVVVGTPGRIKDHIQRGTLKLRRFNLIVLDEVDRMLDMGFVNDVTDILSNTSPSRQSFFFSATIDSKVQTLINGFTNEPTTISLKASSASENVHQNVIRYQNTSEKIDKLHDLLITPDVKKVIVFDETQRGVERLNNELLGRGFSTESIHGGKTQGQRHRALAKFKQSEVTVLVATDVAARGIDVSDITHVINYSVPKAYDDYIHRIGRAGRAGQVGYALTFIEN